METPGSNISYHDLSSLNELRSLAKKDEKQAIHQAAKQFEAVFMNMLLSSMRKANKGFEQDNPLNTNSTEFFRDMHDQQLATELSNQGTLGLADLMVKQLSPDPAGGKLSKHLKMPGDIGEEKVFSAPSHVHKKLNMPSGPSAMKALDPERIVLPARESSAKTTQLAPELTVTAAVSSQSVNQFAAVGQTAGIQQLAAETIWQPQTAKMGQRVQQQPSQEFAVNSVKTEVQPAAEGIAEIQAKPSVSEPFAFVERLLPAAKVAARELGIEPLALLAQAALETGWGKKVFKTTEGSQSHNLFGIKANGAWDGPVAVVDTLEYRQGSAVREKAKFRVYESPEQSLKDYVEFIKTNPRYQQALAHTADAKSYFRQLQAAGYATDPNYAEKLTAVFEGDTFNQVRKLLANNQLNNEASLLATR